MDEPSDVEISPLDFAPQLSDLAAVQALDGVDADPHIDPADAVSPVVENVHFEPLRDTPVHSFHEDPAPHEDVADVSVPEPVPSVDTSSVDIPAPTDTSVTVQLSARPVRDRRPPGYLQDYVTFAHTEKQHCVYSLRVDDAIAARGEQVVMNSINGEFASLYIEMKALEPCFTSDKCLPLHLVLTEKYDAKQTFDKMKASIVIGDTGTD